MPDLLKNKVYIRIFGSIGLLIVGIVFILAKQNFSFWLPAFGLCIGLLFLAFKLVYDYSKDKIIKIEGRCIEANLSLTKTKVKNIYVQTEDKKVRIRIKEKFKQISQGDYVVLYIHSDSTVNIEDHVFILNDYVAIKITTASTKEDLEVNQTGAKLLSLLKKKK